MAGAADLVAALTGGGQIEQKAYGDAAYRIMQARNAQAQMDKRVQDAALVRDQLRSRQNFENTFTPDMSHPDTLKYAILADVADQLKYGQESIGVGQKNDARARAAEIANAMKGDPASLLNAQTAVASGKLLGPGNVLTGPQAEADFAKGVMDVLAGSELVNYRRAGTAKREADIARDAEGNVIPDLETIPKQLMDMLYVQPDTIPVAVDNPGLFTGDTITDLPLNDPRAMKAWENMSDEERAMQMRDLAPDFIQWRAANIGSDPSLQDIDIAVGKYLKLQGVDQSGSAGKDAQDARNNRTVYKSVADLQADIASGKVKSGDVVQTPEGPRVVK
jgi:hypothetical protein